MKAKLSEQQVTLFDNLVRELSTAIKNSILYSAGHPVFDYSVKNFKESLSKWFEDQEHLDISVSPENLLVNGEYVKKKDELYREVADYLHRRGILSLSVVRGIEQGELTDFFTFIKNDVEAIRKDGGIAKKTKSLSHIKLKEIDYTSLLGSAKEKVTHEEKDLWQSLSAIAEESREGVLPESKFEFLIDFLKNPKKSASVLNKIYKEAMAKLESKTAAKSIHDAIGRTCKYFEKDSPENAKTAKGNIAELIASLNPDLVVQLFEQGSMDGKGYDLARAITKDLSDDFIADFIASFLGGGNVFDEKILQVFEKLTPSESGQVESVASVLTDKLFDKKLLGADTLSRLQTSVKELFKAHPDSKFLSEIYKMTVDTFVSRKSGTMENIEVLAPLIRECIVSLKEQRLKREMFDLILNIVWLENDPKEFKKMSTMLINAVPSLLNPVDTSGIRELYELFLEKLRPEQCKIKEIADQIKEVLEAVGKEEIFKILISCIPDAKEADLQNLSYIFTKTKDRSRHILMDAYGSEEKRFAREKFATILRGMGKGISEDIIARFESSDPATTRDLFKILRDCDPEKAHETAGKLLWHKNSQIRLEILRGYQPQTEKERKIVFEMFKRERREDIKNAALTLLAKTRDSAIIDRAFRYLQINIFKRSFLLKLVELCGNFRIQESLPQLKRLFIMKRLINTHRTEKIRVAVAVSLRQLDTAKAMEIVKEGVNDKNERVRSMCNAIIALAKEDKKKKIQQGDMGNDGK